MNIYPNPPMKIARYYPKELRLTYYVGNKIQCTRIGITEDQAKSLIKGVSDGPAEIVQTLEVILK